MGQRKKSARNRVSQRTQPTLECKGARVVRGECGAWRVPVLRGALRAVAFVCAFVWVLLIQVEVVLARDVIPRRSGSDVRIVICASRVKQCVFLWVPSHMLPQCQNRNVKHTMFSWFLGLVYLRLIRSSDNAPFDPVVQMTMPYLMPLALLASLFRVFTLRPEHCDVTVDFTDTHHVLL